MRMNKIIDKLHEADFYIYEEDTDLIRFNHNFLTGCNLAMSLDELKEYLEMLDKLNDEDFLNAREEMDVALSSYFKELFQCEV